MILPAKATDNPAELPVVILCGGEGTRFGQLTQDRPKPLLEIGGEPILLHIMRIYAGHGFRRFVLCLGYKGTMIKEFFLNSDLRHRDMVLDGASNAPRFLGGGAMPDWHITFAETGATTQTGARIARVARYLDAPRFLVTYGDGVADVDLTALLAFHRAHGRIGTLTGVRTRSPFGELQVTDGAVRAFVEKPVLPGLINGGFFVFERAFLDTIPDEPDCILERAPLEGLAARGELMVREHPGFWHCMDTFKDYRSLNEIYATGAAPWVLPGTGAVPA